MNYDELPLKRVRGLSLTRPWPWAFDNGPVPKRIENRSWPAPTRLTGSHQIALHAAKSWGEYDREYIAQATGMEVPPRDEHQASIIFAVCRIASCFEYERTFGPNKTRLRGEPDNQDIWCMGEWCWVIEDYVRLVMPVPCSGAQGLWSFEKKQPELAHLRAVYAESIR